MPMSGGSPRASARRKVGQPATDSSLERPPATTQADSCQGGSGPCRLLPARLSNVRRTSLSEEGPVLLESRLTPVSTSSLILLHSARTDEDAL
ncbi:hypothetical protein HPB50_021957 [Hyalomma asiaticum]|uniref:Uncharacterized protein n=1 Tax=Hyalomma asiaticum TaxID=266040 RepID=A0ACB7TR74_HYAAI|nr:hypothetical protein HPB50_021957 [Hyalomma asiaticum]